MMQFPVSMLKVERAEMKSTIDPTAEVYHYIDVFLGQDLAEPPAQIAPNLSDIEMSVGGFSLGADWTSFSGLSERYEVGDVEGYITINDKWNAVSVIALNFDELRGCDYEMRLKALLHLDDDDIYEPTELSVSFVAEFVGFECQPQSLGLDLEEAKQVASRVLPDETYGDFFTEGANLYRRPIV